MPPLAQPSAPQQTKLLPLSQSNLLKGGEGGVITPLGRTAAHYEVSLTDINLSLPITVTATYGSNDCSY